MTSVRRTVIWHKIMARVVVAPPRGDQTEGCWEWQGPTSGTNTRGHGYPRMCLDGQTVAVHRVMYTNENGYIPGRKQIDHTCRNRCCVNPAHLEMVTHKKNQRRKRTKGVDV